MALLLAARLFVDRLPSNNGTEQLLRIDCRDRRLVYLLPRSCRISPSPELNKCRVILGQSDLDVVVDLRSICLKRRDMFLIECDAGNQKVHRLLGSLQLSIFLPRPIAGPEDQDIWNTLIEGNLFSYSPSPSTSSPFECNISNFSVIPEANCMRMAFFRWSL